MEAIHCKFLRPLAAWNLSGKCARLRRRACVWLLMGLMLVPSVATAQSEETIKVGVLHSLTGTMAISERTLKESLLMLVNQQNRRGGLLGRPIEAVVVDPASNWPLYAEKARELIEHNGVVAIFGCWTSASRKAVLPVVEELNSLLFYPVQYEGQEFSESIFYLGAAPNQQALPAIDFLIDNMGIERWILAGTDYVYPRTANRIMAADLLGRGVDQDDIMLSYTPFGHTEWQRIVGEMKSFARQGKRTAVISTINGDANIGFFREFSAQQISYTDLPVMTFSVGEGELASLNAASMAGHLAAWNYFMSIEGAENRSFITQWQKHTGSPTSVTNDPMEAQYIGFRMWVAAVEKAGSFDADKVRDAMIGLTTKNLSGGVAEMLPNHHITKPVYVGRIQPDGQYQVIWQTEKNIPGDAWSDHLPSRQ